MIEVVAVRDIDNLYIMNTDHINYLLVNKSEGRYYITVIFNNDKVILDLDEETGKNALKALSGWQF